jgi:hypothetical protein
VPVVVASVAGDNTVEVGAVVGGAWRWAAIDPFLVSVYCEGRRIKDAGGLKAGAIGVLVSGRCLACRPGTLQPVLFWLGSGSHAPCVRGAPGRVVAAGEVWLEEERQALCEGAGPPGAAVLVWAWGGREGEGGAAVRGVAVPIMEEGSSLGETSSHISLSEDDKEEEEMEEASDVEEAPEVKDPHLEVVFAGLAWRLEREGGLLGLERRWADLEPALLPAILEEEELEEVVVEEVVLDEAIDESFEEVMEGGDEAWDPHMDSGYLESPGRWSGRPPGAL